MVDIHFRAKAELLTTILTRISLSVCMGLQMKLILSFVHNDFMAQVTSITYIKVVGGSATFGFADMYFETLRLGKASTAIHAHERLD